MSLLLDALKKAAEQKAEKSKQEEAAAPRSDETLVDAGEDVAARGDDTDIKLPPERELQDETEIETGEELETRLERTRIEREADDETGIELPDATQTEVPGASAQMQTGEDETIIFAEEDVADFMGEPEFISRETRPPEDETDLSQLAPRDDQTELERQQAAAAAPAREDDTDLSQLAAEDQTDLSQLLAQAGAMEPAGGDETDIGLAAPEAGIEAAAPVREDSTDLGQPPTDDTDLSQVTVAAEDATDYRQQLEGEDKTDISEPIATVDDLERVAAQQAAVEEAQAGREEAADIDADAGRIEAPASDDTTDVSDDDMSLLLVERDVTNLTAPTSPTDPRAQALPGDDAELGLVDTTRHRAPAAEETATVAAETQSGATTGINYDTQSTTRRTESTATGTYTYAPDNYDRTLMRLPSDDASKLFSGMKSDSDVVMTPDYAKKVFRSKSSAQRLQHYRIYGAIAFVILLGLGIFGMFEYQDQFDNIESSLQPLKRDPMPGVVRSSQSNQDSSLFAQTEAETEVDERTISIIESADEIETETAAEAISEAEAVAEAGAMTATETVDEAVVETETVAATETLEGEVGVSPQADTASPDTGSAADSVSVAIAAEPVETIAAADAADASGSTAGSTLEISSSTRVAEKDIWLQQAYRAYKGGDDELALELYNKVLDIDPGNRNALLARAAINVQKNETSAAIDDYQALLLENPKDTLAMTSLITVANISPQQSETQLKLLLRDNPDSPYLNFALANAYGAQDRWAEAQGHYFTALQNNPDDPNYAYNLAVSLEHISQPRAAITYYQRALENMENGLAIFNENLVGERIQVLEKL